MCENYGVTFIPHGHSLMAAAHVVASMPPDVCPYAEFLLGFMEYKSNFFTDDFMGKNLDGDGFLKMSERPGLGQELDMGRIVRTEEVKFS